MTSITIENYFAQDDGLGFVALSRHKTAEHRFERCGARGPKTRSPDLYLSFRHVVRTTTTSATSFGMPIVQLVATGPSHIVVVRVLTSEFEGASSEGDRKQPPSGENGK